MGIAGTGTYRLSVDAQGTVTRVTILKGFTITAVYDERFSSSKGDSLPLLDKAMLNALMRWRAKPGPSRVVDVYWSFGTRPWVNYGKSNAKE
jgi:outer membrane biosynthesis protein TonB